MLEKTLVDLLHEHNTPEYKVTMVGHLMHGTRLLRNFKRGKDMQISQKFKYKKRKRS
jgi:hypothetical protein